MRIEIVEHERLETPFLEDDVFSLTPSRGYVWAQKAALWVLRKIGAHHMAHKVSYVRHVIDTEKLVERLYESQRVVIEQLGRNPGTLLIGSREFSELMGTALSHQILQIPTSIHWNDRNGYRAIGMRVVVIPWMEGMIAIPDELVAP